MMNMRIILFIQILAIASSLTAQVKVESNLPVAIGSGLTVSFDNKLSVSSSVLNDGVMVLRDTIDFATYAGSGHVIAEGADQQLFLNDATISSLMATGGQKRLHQSVTVADLELDQSIIDVDTNSLEVTGSFIGEGASSYIIGKLIRSGSDSLFYPVGDGINYTPVVLTQISGASPVVGVLLVSSDVAGTAGYGLLDVSDQRYWQISEESGTIGDANLQLPLIDESGMPFIDQTTIAHGSTVGGTFTGATATSRSGNLVSGTVTAPVTSGAGLYAIGYYFNEQLRVQDSLALVRIYESTGGDEWIGASGWMTNNLDLWDKIILTDKRVSTLNLSSNNLIGTFPTISEGLELVSDLNLSSNELEVVGDISRMAALQTVDVSNNRLQFGSLEGVLSVSSGAVYAPQKTILDKIRTIEEIGTTYTIDRTISGSSNSYTWVKNGSNIAETSGAFDVDITGFEQDGTYIARVTNSLVDGLTLTTEPVILRVSSLERDSVSLMAVYEALDGPNSTLSDWPNLPIADWQEITLTNSRVSGLNVSEANLNGELPEDIVDIEGMTSADFSQNDITGIPDLNGYFPNMTVLDLSGNRLMFDDLEPNAAVAILDYSNQQRFGVAVNDTIHVGSLVDLSQDVAGNFNQYQWFYSNEQVTDQAMGGLVSSTLILDSINYSNMGQYELRVINTAVPNLILRSEYQTVLASADIEISALDFGDQLFSNGEAYALKVTEPGQPFDTIQTAQPSNGKFTFSELLLDDYVLAVAPNNLIEFMPTYYSSTDLWTEADTLQLRQDEADTISMAPVPGIIDGEASISGNIESDFTESGGRINARRKVKRAGCSVRRFVPKGRIDQEDGEFVLYAYVQSNDDGQFEFNGLEDGLYRFNVEYPGIPMDEDSYVEFTIGEGGIEDEVLTLQVTVLDDAIVVEKIERLGFYRNYFKDLTVYPNPANSFVTIGYGKLLSESVKVRLVDLEGNIVTEEVIEKGNNKELKLDVSQISGGIYILNFVDSSLGAEKITSFKVVVQHN